MHPMVNNGRNKLKATEAGPRNGGKTEKRGKALSNFSTFMMYLLKTARSRMTKGNTLTTKASLSECWYVFITTNWWIYHK